eukprot:4600545-Alexandrium_andersonii.AAC.1
MDLVARGTKRPRAKVWQLINVVTAYATEQANLQVAQRVRGALGPAGPPLPPPPPAPVAAPQATQLSADDARVLADGILQAADRRTPVVEQARFGETLGDA